MQKYYEYYHYHRCVTAIGQLVSNHYLFQRIFFFFASLHCLPSLFRFFWSVERRLESDRLLKIEQKRNINIQIISFYIDSKIQCSISHHNKLQYLAKWNWGGTIYHADQVIFIFFSYFVRSSCFQSESKNLERQQHLWHSYIDDI